MRKEATRSNRISEIHHQQSDKFLSNDEVCKFQELRSCRKHEKYSTNIFWEIYELSWLFMTKKIRRKMKFCVLQKEV